MLLMLPENPHLRCLASSTHFGFAVDAVHLQQQQETQTSKKKQTLLHKGQKSRHICSTTVRQCTKTTPTAMAPILFKSLRQLLWLMFALINAATTMMYKGIGRMLMRRDP
mmetsp:Transcript_74119/g.173970  ORF Transcript_74119/g.173970 Transcript_74119/m.173970 type:complete len:110 (-) Transcript_74119:74-403(-)